MAAHDYTREWSRNAISAEAYDVILVEFLEKMLSRNDANNTIIVIRSDHGLQGGTAKSEYSVQIEHTRPWTQIIVPQSYQGLNLNALDMNQRRLTSGFDLYKTLRELMMMTSPLADDRKTLWSYNIFKDEISESRTCVNGKIPLEWCRNEIERTSLVPNFVTCNPYEHDQKLFCPKPNGDSGYIAFDSRFEEEDSQPPPLSLDVLKENWKSFSSMLMNAASLFTQNSDTSEMMNEESIWSNRMNQACDDGSSTQQQNNHDHPHLSIWEEIQNITSKYPKAPVSGGIFLYKRQQNLLKFLVQTLSTRFQAKYGRKMRFCETGFGSGHLASFILAGTDAVDVITFDKFNRPYQIPIADMLSKKYPNRFLKVVGDSCQTVPKYLMSNWTNAPLEDLQKVEQVQCDFLHGSSLCPNDNIDLVTYSPSGIILTSTAMNSLTDKAVYFGPNAQWRKLRLNGCIKDITCFEEGEIVLDKNYVFNKAGGTISHKHCIAISTGKCNHGVGRIIVNNINATKTAPTRKAIVEPSPLEQILTTVTRSSSSFKLKFQQLCPNYQVNVPS